VVEDISIRYLSMLQPIGGAGAACERLPTAPGVYAWFRNLRIQGNSTTEFVDSLVNAIEAPAAPQHQARVGLLHHVTLDARSELSLTKRERLEPLARDSRFREHMVRLLDAAAVLQAPLYVGKARNLRVRVQQHLIPTSDLSRRLREAGVDIRTCNLAYAVLDDDYLEDDQTLTLIEEIITRICRPGFVLRPG